MIIYNNDENDYIYMILYMIVYRQFFLISLKLYFLFKKWKQCENNPCM